MQACTENQTQCRLIAISIAKKTYRLKPTVIRKVRKMTQKHIVKTVLRREKLVLVSQTKQPYTRNNFPRCTSESFKSEMNSIGKFV